MNRPLIIGEKVYIRGVSYGYHQNTDHLVFKSINIGITNIPPETIFGAKNEKKAIMKRLNHVDLSCDCCI